MLLFWQGVLNWRFHFVSLWTPKKSPVHGYFGHLVNNLLFGILLILLPLCSVPWQFWWTLHWAQLQGDAKMDRNWPGSQRWNRTLSGWESFKYCVEPDLSWSVVLNSYPHILSVWSVDPILPSGLPIPAGTEVYRLSHVKNDQNVLMTPSKTSNKSLWL